MPSRRLWLLALLGGACTCLVPAASRATAAEVAPFFETMDLFKAGEGGYALYHIPGVVVTARGTVLAWCEARKKGGDWDDIQGYGARPGFAGDALRLARFNLEWLTDGRDAR